MKNVAIKFFHNETGPQSTELVQDIVQSKGWRQVFGTPEPRACERILWMCWPLSASKDKEAVKEVKENAKTKNQKLLIGNTAAKSRILLDGKTPGDVQSRVEIAKKIERVCQYGDEKRCLLFIVALDYPYSYLQSAFGYSSNTVTAGSTASSFDVVVFPPLI